jgi:hypothetical protein
VTGEIDHGLVKTLHGLDILSLRMIFARCPVVVRQK